MSKSDQFAVPADASATVGKPASLAPRIFGWGCGGVFLVLAIFAITVTAKFNAAQQQPVDQKQVIQSLAGVPIYPGATFDKDLTRNARGGLAAAKGMDSYKMRTVAGLRTADDPQKVLAFYDSNMQGYGFTKTTLGGGTSAQDSASYTSQDTTVIVQTSSEPGEDNQLILCRFDRTSRSALKQPGNVVTPEDFRKAHEDALKKKKAMDEQKKASGK